ncbi:hypothetical protein AOQ84DRAFT_388645 [Glonium stellatum]|uniref:Uncharacterized protein n=1 Tax=Glonium stellatum TaxID=574774 RepID=A0A8E2F1H2_9PEZI|nr:hypothetical protein AOQ84DRAFT_388645 [Glonium stellatum]
MPRQLDFLVFPDDDHAEHHQQSFHQPDYFDQGGFSESLFTSCENGHGNLSNTPQWAQETLPIRPALPTTPLLPYQDFWGNGTNGLDLYDLPGLSNAGSDENASTASSPQQAMPDSHILDSLDSAPLPPSMILIEPQRAVMHGSLPQSSKGDFRCAYCSSVFTHRYLLK